jgi:hypothetical protein
MFSGGVSGVEAETPLLKSFTEFTRQFQSQKSDSFKRFSNTAAPPLAQPISSSQVRQKRPQKIRGL